MLEKHALTVAEFLSFGNTKICWSQNYIINHFFHFKKYEENLQVDFFIRVKDLRQILHLPLGEFERIN